MRKLINDLKNKFTNDQDLGKVIRKLTNDDDFKAITESSSNTFYNDKLENLRKKYLK